MEASNPHNDRLADLGAANRAKLVSELRKGASLPLHLLSEATGLSRPTLKSHLDALVTAGIATREEARVGTQGGRPAASYSLNASGALLVAMDISLHEHRFMLVDLAGTVRAARVSELPAPPAPGDRSRLLIEQLHDFLDEADTPTDRVSLFSAAIGAQVDQRGSLGRLPVGNALIDSDFASRLPAPLILENDLKAAAYAEHRIGCAQDALDVIHALLWYRVAAGIILDGRIRRGARELAGELNMVASTSMPAPEDWTTWPRFLEMLLAAEKGDARALESVDGFCALTATQIAYLAMSIDPDKIVLGGPLAHRSPMLVDRLISALDKELPTGPSFAIEVAALRSWGPALGAALRGLEAIETRLLGAPSTIDALVNASPIAIPIPCKPQHDSVLNEENE